MLALTCMTAAVPDGYAQKRDNIRFKKHVLTTEFISEGAGVADVNKDGKPDIIAGAFWFEAPSWKQHELAPPVSFAVNTYGNSFLNFTMDVNQDGWVDYIRVDHPGEAVKWYENPKNQPGHWKEHLLHTSLGHESPLLVDVDGDKRLDLVGNDSKAKQMIWLKSPAKKGATEWEKYIISTNDTLSTHRYTHGLGFADLNNDGRKDIIIRQGWWEAPKNRRQTDWKFHPAPFGEECAQMYVHDFNQDGLLDIVSTSAHRFGVWWYQQGKDAAGNAAWTRHEIDQSIGQTHGLAFTDLNGDGHPDLVTGKRYFAHNGKDPGELDPPVLAWYEFIPGKNPSWKKHEIDNNSGAGLHVEVLDMNQDGLPDIVIGNKRGVFYFEQIP